MGPNRLATASLLIASAVVLGACQSFGGSGVTAGGGAGQTGSWTCSNGVALAITRAERGLAVSDSRGFDITLAPDPPGQRERYATDGHALVFADRTASWFASGRQPSDCRR